MMRNCSIAQKKHIGILGVFGNKLLYLILQEPEGNLSRDCYAWVEAEISGIGGAFAWDYLNNETS